jgi:hypothetical protein
MSKAKDDYEQDLKTRKAAYNRYINDPYNGSEDINTCADIYIKELEKKNEKMKRLLAIIEDDLFNNLPQPMLKQIDEVLNDI